MPHFLGEYECKIDDKGRMRLPSQLIKQLDEAEQQAFVINRGFEQCLTLYPMQEWQKITELIGRLNQFDPDDRKFTRYFYRGATELSLDGSDRLLIPRLLAEYASISKEVILFAYQEKIEIWDKEQYTLIFDEDPNGLSSLAASVMRKLSD
jgi:MraZ protein